MPGEATGSRLERVQGSMRGGDGGLDTAWAAKASPGSQGRLGARLGCPNARVQRAALVHDGEGHLASSHRGAERYAGPHGGALLPPAADEREARARVEVLDLHRGERRAQSRLAEAAPQALAKQAQQRGLVCTLCVSGRGAALGLSRALVESSGGRPSAKLACTSR